MKTTDLHWLAGILEGEGRFSFRHYTCGQTRPPYPRWLIGLTTTDGDIAERVANLLEVKVTGPYSNAAPSYKGAPRKPRYQVQLGRCADAWLAAKLHPLMGERRRAAIDVMLAEDGLLPKGRV